MIWLIAGFCFWFIGAFFFFSLFTVAKRSDEMAIAIYCAQFPGTHEPEVTVNSELRIEYSVV